MKQVFDPTQETLEEYLRRINSDGPWSKSRDVLYLNHGQKEEDKANNTGEEGNSANFSED